MGQDIRQRLVTMAEPEFQRFTSSLLPGIEPILGVRLPKLRKLAKEITKNDWRAYLSQAKDGSYEEIMLQGMVIGYAVADIEEILKWTSYFIPKINNWSVCDSFCSGLKAARDHPEQMWDFMQPYFSGREEFSVRFSVVMLLTYYIDDVHLEQDLRILDSVSHKGYYVKMAVAWAISICFIRFPDKTMAYLEHNMLDPFTYRKALQKIIESRCIDEDTRKRIRLMYRS